MKSLLLASSAVVGAVLPLAAPAAIERVPGAVEVIPDTAFKNDPTSTIKDILGRVPGVVVQSRWGPDARYRHPGGFYAGPSVEWSPDDSFADNANSLTIDSYALLNLKVGFDTQQGWSAYLEGRNLTDERYISSVAIAGVAAPDAEIFNPGTGRAVYAGLRHNW